MSPDTAKCLPSGKITLVENTVLNVYLSKVSNCGYLWVLKLVMLLISFFALVCIWNLLKLFPVGGDWCHIFLITGVMMFTEDLGNTKQNEESRMPFPRNTYSAGFWKNCTSHLQWHYLHKTFPDITSWIPLSVPYMFTFLKAWFNISWGYRPNIAF